jgi:hypothetical protein
MAQVGGPLAAAQIPATRLSTPFEAAKLKRAMSSERDHHS